MKKSILILALLAATFTTSSGTIRTVSNYTPSPGQYNTIDAAVTAAVNGDTIYVHGSPISYQGATVTKQLTFIGAGMNPQKTNAYQTTIEYFVNINSTMFNLTTGSSFTKIIGFTFIAYGVYCVNIGAGVHDITINRNYTNCCTNFATLNGGVYNVNITENRIYTATINNMNNAGNNNITISNNVFFLTGATLFLNFGGGVTNVTLSNNVFYSDNNNTRALATVGTGPFTFNNNVFNWVNLNNIYGSFSNNITYNCTNNTPWVGNTDFGGNIANTSPQFVSQTAIDAGTYSIDPLLFDFNSGSPCLTANHAGYVEMGVNGGGVYSWRNANASQLPFVYSLTIPTPNIQSGQNLQIEVIGKKHD